MNKINVTEVCDNAQDEGRNKLILCVLCKQPIEDKKITYMQIGSFDGKPGFRSGYGKTKLIKSDINTQFCEECLKGKDRDFVSIKYVRVSDKEKLGLINQLSGKTLEHNTNVTLEIRLKERKSLREIGQELFSHEVKNPDQRVRQLIKKLKGKEEGQKFLEDNKDWLNKTDKKFNEHISYSAEMKIENFWANTVDVLPLMNDIGGIEGFDGDYVTSKEVTINGVKAYVDIHYVIEISLRAKTMEKLQSKIDAVKERMIENDQQFFEIELGEVHCSS